MRAMSYGDNMHFALYRTDYNMVNIRFACSFFFRPPTPPHPLLARSYSLSPRTAVDMLHTLSWRAYNLFVKLYFQTAFLVLNSIRIKAMMS